MRIPAFCDNCGAIFPSAISVGVTSIGNIQNCPFCGHFAHILDGTFGIAADKTLRVISAPDITHERLRAFEQLIRSAYKRQISLDQLEREAAEIDPQLAKAAKGIRSAPFWATLILFSIVAISRACSVDIKIALDGNELVDQIYNRPPQQILDQDSKQVDNAEQHGSSNDADTSSRSSNKKN